MSEIIVSKGVTSTGINLTTGEMLTILSGGKAVRTTLNNRGMMQVSEGGQATSTTIANAGRFSVYSGGLAYSTRLYGGAMSILGTAYYTTLSGGAATVASGGFAYDTNVDSEGKFIVSGGVASATKVDSNGSLRIFSGGVASNTEVYSWGSMSISDGGTATGRMNFDDYAVVSAEEGGILDFDLTQTAAGESALLNNLAVVTGTPTFTLTVSGTEANGKYNLAEGATGFDKTITVKNTSGVDLGTLTIAGGMQVIDGQNYTLTLNGSVLSVMVGNTSNVFSGDVTGETKIISSGSSAVDATVNHSGVLIIENGAAAYNILVDTEGVIFVSSGAKVGNLTLGDDGGALIGADVVVSNIVIHSGGVAAFGKDASAVQYSSGNLVQSNLFMNGGLLQISGGRVEGAFISKGFTDIMGSGLLTEATLVGADVFVNADAAISNVTVADGAIVRVSSGSDVQHARFNSGGILTGIMRNLSDLTFDGGTLELDVSRLPPGNDFLVDAKTFNEINRNDDYTVVLKISLTPMYSYDIQNDVEIHQSGGPGTYQLIEGAAGFNKTITVLNPGWEEIGTISLGRTSKINGDYYTLNLDANNNLTVTVADNDPLPFLPDTTKADIDCNSVSDVLFQYTGGDYQLGYWMNGTNEWRGQGLAKPAEWEVLGSYDMDNNGFADSVLVGNVEVGGVKGAYIGYYLNSVDTDANWQNIGYLNNAENIAWKNKVGNLSGIYGMNSIVWYAPELYALGAWTDGTTDWVTLSRNFGGKDWTLVGCGDFDGDGKDSVLMNYNNGQLFYAVDIGGADPQKLGGSDWSNGWEVRAIGDFMADGKDDIVLFHKQYGSMVMLLDGNADNYMDVGQLAADDWFVVGAGDYNGDNMDDLLVRQKSTGMLGYYSSGDMADWVEMGRGVDMNWTVIA